MKEGTLSDFLSEHVTVIPVMVPPPVPRCDCGNRLKVDDVDGECEWCASGECTVLVEVDGVAGGERIGTCEADGRPIFRSHLAGTIYHASADR